MIETPEAFFLRAELPGVEPGSVEVLQEGEVLTLKGEKITPTLGEGEKLIFAERSEGSFVRRFSFPRGLGEVEASLKNGVLTLRLAKPKEEQAKRIKVSEG